MADYTERLWRYPAFAIAANVVLLLWLIPLRSWAIGMTMRLYEAMFWVTPVVGIVILAWIAWLKLWAPHLGLRQAAWWSLLAVTEPVWLWILQVVLSGFER